MIGRTYELVDEKMPIGIDDLRTEALAEGHRFVEHLVADWMARKIRFDRPGEALLAARVNGVLAGLGGLTIDPILPGSIRLRRFYIRPVFRRRGIGCELAAALLARVNGAKAVTVNAAPASFPFWEPLGFKPDPRDGHTHIFLTTPPLVGIGREEFKEGFDLSGNK